MKDDKQEQRIRQTNLVLVYLSKSTISLFEAKRSGQLRLDFASPELRLDFASFRV